MKPMENNKAISQINKVVQLLKTARMIDLDHKVLIEHLYEAAEMINGLDGRGNLQEGWISVEDDREPTPNLEYTICVNSNSLGTAIYEERNGEYVFVNDNYDDFSSDTVTHWMPLPQPPNSKPDRQVKSAEETLVQYLERRFVTADGVIEWNEQVKGLIEKWK